MRLFCQVGRSSRASRSCSRIVVKTIDRKQIAVDQSVCLVDSWMIQAARFQQHEIKSASVPMARIIIAMLHQQPDLLDSRMEAGDIVYPNWVGRLECVHICVAIPNSYR